MKKSILLIVLAMVHLCVGLAQETKTDANIIGDVICKGKHVPYITISVDGTTIGTLTDATGHFQITHLPVGTFTIRAGGIGYTTVSETVTTALNTTKEIRFIVEEDLLRIESVVISADRMAMNRSEAPVVVNSIDPQFLEVTQSRNIAEGLCFTPGLRTECNCQNCGFTQLRMNGMEGPYTQILMNSRPVFSGLAGVYGLELIPANMVERLEVIRGGGSALFGGNAIAGTLNIITKEPTINTFLVDGQISVAGPGENTNNETAFERQLAVNTSVVTDDGCTGGYLYGLVRDRDPYDQDGDGYSEEVLIENSTFGFNLFHNPSQKSKISLDGYRIKEFRRGGNKLDMLPHAADVAEQLDHTISGANLGYDLFTNRLYNKLSIYSAIQLVDRDSYYGAQHDMDAYGHSKDVTGTVGATFVLNSEHFIFAPSSTLIGLDNHINYLDDRKLDADGEMNTLLSNQLVNTLGTFVQHDWKSEKVNLSMGLRLDHYLIRDVDTQHNETAEDITKTVLCPRVSVLYKIIPDLRFRLSYAKGYRAPQIFSEDLHIELTGAKQVVHLNETGLEQEISHSLSSSLNINYTLGNSLHDFLIEGFYTRLIDPFVNEYYPLDEEGRAWADLRTNATGARVQGINLEYNTHLGSAIDIQTGFSFLKSLYDESVEWGDVTVDPSRVTRRFLRTPDRYGYGTITWSGIENFRVTLSLNYTGSMYVPHYGLEPDDFDDPEERLQVSDAIAAGEIIQGERLEKSEDFLLTDLLISYTVRLSNETKIQIYAGIKNIFSQTQETFDSGLYRDAGYIYGPCQPRSFGMGLKIGNFLL